MANSVQGNKIYIDTTGALKTERTLVSHILFTPSATNDSITFKETSSGDVVLKLQSANAKTTMHFRFETIPMLFNNGVYVSAISSGALCTLVTTSAGKT